MNAKQFKNRIKLLKKVIPNNLDILFISVFGSYNYGLESPISDIDYKLVYIPTLNDLIQAKPASEEIKITNGILYTYSLPRFVQRIKEFEISFFEPMNSSYIWINPLHKDLFDILKETVNTAIHNNKQLYIEKICDTMKTIYRTHVNSPIIQYNPKKAYNIPRLQLLLHSVLKNDTYDLKVPKEKHNHIFNIKAGIINKTEANEECFKIIQEVESLKQKYSNNLLYHFEKVLDDIVRSAIKHIIVQDELPETNVSTNETTKNNSTLETEDEDSIDKSTCVGITIHTLIAFLIIVGLAYLGLH